MVMQQEQRTLQQNIQFIFCTALWINDVADCGKRFKCAKARLLKYRIAFCGGHRIASLLKDSIDSQIEFYSDP